MPKSKEELEKLKEDYKNLTSEANELSDEELQSVTGGSCTTYGDGYDGVERPIVTTLNSCDLYKLGWRYAEGNMEVCDTCEYNSKNNRDNPKRISLVSAWCLHPDRAK